MSSNLAPLFNEGLSENLFLSLDTYDMMFRHFMHMETADTRYVWHQVWEGYGLPQFRMPGGPFIQDSIKPSFNKAYIIRSFGLGDTFAREDIDDDLYGVINRVIPKKSGLMADSFYDLQNLELANFFGISGFAGGTNVAGMSDGLSLFNTAHPTSASQISNTFSNTFATGTDLSIASMQWAQGTLRNQTAPNGITHFQNEVDTLVINPSMRYVARQICHGPKERGTSDNNENYLRDDHINIVEWPYFQAHGTVGTQNSWFVVGKKHWLFFLLRSGMMIQTDYDIATNSLICSCNIRFDYGATDPRGTVGSLGQ